VSIFRKLLAALGGGRAGGGDGGDTLWLYVQCNACGEKIRVRISRANDLSPEFEGESDYPTSYHLSKEIVGTKCFRRIHVDVDFDGQKRPTEQRITGGRFITREEYESAPAPSGTNGGP
jgi:hypothetical protein